MKSAAIITLTLIATVVVIAFLLVRDFNNDRTTVESSHAKEFIMDTPFKKIQKGLRKGKFEQETMRINNAVMLEQRWIDHDIHFERLLRKDRYWEFKGKMYAKVQVSDPKAGTLQVDLIEDVVFAINRIEIKTQLARPLDVGVTDLKESIIMLPVGETQTNVRLSSYLKLQRYIPKMFKDYAQTELDNASSGAIANMEQAIRSLQ